MNFPHISHLDDLLPFVKDNEQIRVQQDAETGYIVVSYMIQDEDTFTGENELFERECRGITFYPDGKIAARTLTKFFNVGQRDDVKPDKLRWQDVTRIMVKRDGSMVTPVMMVDGTVRMKTKKTFSSKEANAATDILHRTDNNQTELEWIKKLLQDGFTPTFEFTSPKFPIVLKYEKDELTLLHVRENVSGRYLSEAEIKLLVPPFSIVENVMHEFLSSGVPANLVSWDKLKEYAHTATGGEGVVIQFGQEMIKLKTAWYCELHSAVTFTRWRDVARSVCSDSSDDLKGAFALTGRSIEPILEVERKIKLKIDAAKTKTLWIAGVGIYDGLDAKGMALKFKDHPLFSQIMSAFRDKEINWMAWYEKNHLESDWGLEVI